MATTVTPHLSLVKPDAAETVNVTTQLNANYDKLDSSALSHTNRLTTVEGVAGIVPWTNWDPVIKAVSDTLTKTITVAQFIKQGELVTCEVHVTITSLGKFYGPIAGDNTITIKLPFVKKNIFATGQLFLVFAAGNKSMLTPVYSADTQALNFEFSTFPADPTDFTLEANQVIRASFQYRTTGVAVV